MSPFTSADGLPLHLAEWPSRGEPRGVVQIAHGMGEHSARYGRVAEHLAGLGYAVYANDHRGHGRSMAGAPGHLGAHGWTRLVADLAALARRLRDRHPGLPLVLFGHSMGSFALQHGLVEYPGLADAVVLSGATALDQLVSAPVDPDSGGLFAAFNAAFAPNRTDFDWLSRDESEVDAYIADPLCGFALDEAGMAELNAAAPRMAEPPAAAPTLPVYVMVGDRDPLNGGLALSDLLVRRYQAAGLTDVTYRTYPGARHELLNETNRDEVTADLTAWLTRVTGR
ncbi:alpha/beta hydrolase [Actinokineospora iranica]|uniref:Lysophospholipase, alpha-beta hydrolase superfamily n=1 Tax=Actinokineospora iranica TaxID=1271860 RepID=A0A1G6QHW9_9PSEU|nr:alpha/beta hydrolase [Actinokineospora iranica]SDC91245.1 Lysophospholipase, alpha-beta hydrolase superfamily [Actinokineospora iranica]